MAIDLHLFLKGKDNKVIPQYESELRKMIREILGSIAEGFSQRSPKAKRFFNFKAIDACRRMLMDLEFLHDVKSIPTKEYEHFNEEYEICIKQLYKLNFSILSQVQDSEEPVKPVVKSSDAQPAKA